jgi:AraC-like DNA-binding protein
MRGSAIFAFCDPDPLAAQASLLGMTLMATRPGGFRARLTRVECDGISVALCEEALPGIAHLSISQDKLCLIFPVRAGPPATIGGADVGFGQVALLRAGSRCHMRTPGDFHWGLVAFSPGYFAAPGAMNAATFGNPETVQIRTPARTDMRRLLRLHHRATSAAQTSPALLRTNASAHGLEQAFADALAPCLFGDKGPEPDAPHGARALRQQRIMNRLEDLVQADRAGVMTPDALATALGISGRSLRAYCRTHLDLGPARYLLLRRLNTIRHCLAHASQATASVKDIAARHGFPEPGRLAKVYRAYFGEPPSATLRRMAHPDGS